MPANSRPGALRTSHWCAPALCLSQLLRVRVDGDAAQAAQPASQRRRLSAGEADRALPPASDDDDSLELPLAQRLGAPRVRVAPERVVLESNDDELPVANFIARAATGGPARAQQNDSDSDAQPRGRGRGRGGVQAAAAEARGLATAQRQALKAQDKALKAAARLQQRSASGKLAAQQISVFLDTRLASTPLGRALGDALHASKFAHSVAQLPVERSVCWVRHEAREEPWAGAVPWGDAAAAAREGALAVPYVLLALEAQQVVAAVEGAGGLEGLVGRCRRAHPGATLGLCSVALDQHLRAREQREFSAAEPARGFRRAVVDSALTQLITHLRGVRQRDAKDAAQAAEHCVLLTEALAKQPFRSEDSFLVLFAADHKAGGRGGAGAQQRSQGDDGEGGAPQPALPPGARSEPSLAASWVAALASVPACSADSAAAIARAYPSMAALSAAYRAPGLSQKAARELLKDLMGSGGGVAAKSRRVGPACSERMWKIFRPRDKDDAGDEFAA